MTTRSEANFLLAACFMLIAAAFFLAKKVGDQSLTIDALIRGMETNSVTEEEFRSFSENDQIAFMEKGGKVIFDK